jgi:hypothetical protein
MLSLVTASLADGIHDAHIAEVARSAAAAVVVTDNRRRFLSALRYDMRVETPTEIPRHIQGKGDVRSNRT